MLATAPVTNPDPKPYEPCALCRSLTLTLILTVTYDI